MIKKILVRTFFVLVVLFGIALISINVLSNKIPEASSGISADLLAIKAEDALGKCNFEKTRFVRWRFMGTHHFVWDKFEGLVFVEYSDFEIFLNLKNLDSSKVYESKVLIDDSADAKDVINEAYGYFCNDSFWLVAPYKFFDEGVLRGIVEENGESKLMVAYESGGVTPGDVYVWDFDENFKPENVQMWTSNLPIKGMTFSWANYKSFWGGIELAQEHKFGPLNIKIEDLEIGNSLSDIKVNSKTFNRARLS